MKRLSPFVLCSTAAALCLGTVSASAGFVTPRVPPSAVKDATRSATDLRKTPNGLPTTWTVTTVNDAGPGSLRDIIAGAAAGDSINFDLPLPATIVLSSTLLIDKNLTVLGPGPDELTVMRSDARKTPSFRVLDVEAGVVTIAGLTIRNGSAYSGTYIHDNVGGAILNRGALTVSNCVITGNSAPTTDWGTNVTPSVSLGFGAGIFSDTGSQLALVNSTINCNQASAAGGAVCTHYADGFVAVGCTLSGNSADIQGGGLNFQGLAGSLESCTLSGNSTPPDAAGSAFLLITWPGETATLTLTACTVVGNTGSTNGACTLAGLSGNLGCTNRLLSTLVAANEGPNVKFYGNPTLVSLGHNLDSDGTSGLLNGANGDLVGTVASPIDAKLGPLQDNGGPTFTIPLLPGSPALDSGACTDASGAPLLMDQRGFPRPQGAGCDIGAFENQTPTLICPVAETLSGSKKGARATLTATVADPDGDALTVTWTLNGVTRQTDYVAATHPPRSSGVTFRTFFPLGTNTVGVVVSDGKAAPMGCSTSVIVVPKKP